MKKRNTSNFSTNKYSYNYNTNNKFNNHTRFCNSVSKVTQIDEVLDSIQNQYKGKEKEDAEKLFKDLYH